VRELRTDISAAAGNLRSAKVSAMARECDNDSNGESDSGCRVQSAEGELTGAETGVECGGRNGTATANCDCDCDGKKCEKQIMRESELRKSVRNQGRK